MEHVTFQELQAALSESRQALISHMETGFSGVHARQDVTNGRLLSAEKRLADHDIKLDRIPTAGSEHAPITRREVTLVLATLGGCVALLKGLPWLLTIGAATR